MKLLVTGGDGFIGSNFILKLLEEHEEFKITNIDAELGGSNPKNLLKINNHKNYKFVKGNITNHKLMKELINECDIVDMECYSLAYVCKRYGVDFKSYKWVSDDGNVDSWEENAAIGFENFKKMLS